MRILTRFLGYTNKTHVNWKAPSIQLSMSKFEILKLINRKRANSLLFRVDKSVKMNLENVKFVTTKLPTYLQVLLQEDFNVKLVYREVRLLRVFVHHFTEFFIERKSRNITTSGKLHWRSF